MHAVEHAVVRKRAPQRPYGQWARQATRQDLRRDLDPLALEIRLGRLQVAAEYDRVGVGHRTVVCVVARRAVGFVAQLVEVLAQLRDLIRKQGKGRPRLTAAWTWMLGHGDVILSRW